MAGLQRSAVSFRRQGSSGLVFDDKFLSGELNKVMQNDQQLEQGKDQDDKTEIKEAKSPRTIQPISIERSPSNGGRRVYRTDKVPPAIEPPSPKVSACGFCSAFSKTANKNHRTKPGKRRSR